MRSYSAIGDAKPAVRQTQTRKFIVAQCENETEKSNEKHTEKNRKTRISVELTFAFGQIQADLVSFISIQNVDEFIGML